MTRLPLRTAFLASVAGLACRAADGPASARPVFPREKAHAPRTCDFDVLRYAIELELLPAERAIRAECRVRLQPLDLPLEEVELDLVGLTVDGVSDERGRALSFSHERGRLAIALAEPLPRDGTTELIVRYGGTPERGLYYAGARLDGSGPTLVFTHGQTESNRGWFPCFDAPGERAASELVVTMPRGWVATANGERVEASEQGDLRRERWRLDFPHPSYLVSLVAGELFVVEGRAGGVPLVFLAEPQYADWIGETFAETDEILAFLADTTGVPYPYPKYSQAAVANFPWGGMENISATTLTPLLLGDERAHRDQPPYLLLAHEAAHQWFGDLFTCADWSHLWLNEGLATYATLLYVERSRGADEFRARLREVQEAYLARDGSADCRPTVWNVWKEPDDVFDERAYQGAAARLHLLRFLLGDEAFFAGLRAYAGENAGRSVVTADFQRALERVSGRDLDAFFEQWFLARGFPEFQVGWEWGADEGEVVLEVEQLQDGRDGTPAVFLVPLEVELRDERGTTAFRLEIDERRERFVLPSAERPLYVCFDHHGWIPKRIHEDKEPAEWLAIARLDDDENARREAARVLGRLAAAARERGDGARAGYELELVARLRTDPSPWVRADAATALGAAAGEEAGEALRRAALEDGEARVRTAALLALRSAAPDPGLASLAEDAFDRGYSYQTMAAAAALLCSAAPERAFEFLRAGLGLDSPHDVLAGLLLRHLAELPDQGVPAELRRWAADPALAPGTRAVAVELLGSSTRDTLETSRFLVPFLEEESFALRQAAVQSLARLGDAGARRALEAYYPFTRTAPERRTIEALLERREF